MLYEHAFKRHMLWGQILVGRASLEALAQQKDVKVEVENGRAGQGGVLIITLGGVGRGVLIITLGAVGRMAPHWLLAIHGCLAVLGVVAFLCGHWPIFQGTFVQRLNYFFTAGIYDLLLRAAVVAFGRKGRHVLVSVEHYCCERPNPILQILYLATIGVTYYFVLKSSVNYIPGYYVSEIHWYISAIAVLVGIILFFLTSFSDPGIINSENVSKYLLAYSYDGTIYTEKLCATCNIPRPARSKHCSICDHCVARFDHHCGWMNNCIGEKNLRYFLAFLLWHFFLCLYGAVTLAAILAGELKDHQVLHILTVYYGIGSSFHRLFPHVIQWLLNFYNMEILLIIFLAVISLLLAGFISYHVHLLITNTTTNETFKWDNYKRWQLSLMQVKAVTESLKQTNEIVSADHPLNRDANASDMKYCLFSCPKNLKEQYAHWQNDRHCFVKNNIYDRGLLHNICEVICPLSCREWFSSRKGD